MNLATRTPMKGNVVLAVLAAALAVPTCLQLQRDADSFVDMANVPLLFDGFTADNVFQITMAQPKKEQPAPDANNPQAPKVVYDKIDLQRVEKGFALASGELAGAPVSKDRVERDIFAHLRTIRADRDVLVQPNATPQQLATFGLDEAQAFVLRVTDATPQHNVIAELLVGNDAGAGQTGTEAVRGVFVRKSDSTDVVLYELDKPWRRDVLQDQWLDRVLAKIEPDKVRKLSIRNTATGATAVTFARADGKASWAAIDPPAGLGAVRQTEVERVVQRLASIEAQSFLMSTRNAGNQAGLGLAPAKIELELVAKDGDRERTLRLEVGNQLEGKNEYYLKCNESAFVMTWPASTVTAFELDAKAQLFDPASPDQKSGDGDKKDDKKDGK